MIPRSRPLPVTHSPLGAQRARIIQLGFFLLTVALIYTLGYPFSLAWNLPHYAAFGQLHTLVFAGNAATLLLILSWMARRPDVPQRYRWSGATLIVAHLFTALTAVLWIPAYTADHGVAHVGMAIYVLILFCGNFSLMATVPWWTWPRFQLMRLVADTVLAMSVVDLALTVVFPSFLSGWSWTPTLTAAVFRLETSIGLCFWYGMVYRRFGAFAHPSVRFWALGMVGMLLTDSALLWGTYQLERGATDRLLGAAMPFWMVHQTMWTLGLFGVLETVPSWRSTPIESAPPGASRWSPTLRQGLLLGGLAVVVVVASSFRATVWFVCAIVLRQLVNAHELRKERAQLAHANTTLHTTNQELAQAQRQLVQLNRDLAAANSKLKAASKHQAQLLIYRQQTAVTLAHDMSGFMQDTLLALSRLKRSEEVTGRAIPNELAQQIALARQGLVASIDLLNAMVAAAQLDAGMLMLRLAPTPPAPLITAVVRQLQPRADHAHIRITLQLEEPLPLILVDQPLITRALLNIVGNAIKYTAIRHKHGAGRIAVQARASNGTLLIRVADNGTGIAPADLARLGQRFVRGSLDAAAPTGFGLGLAFARGVIEQHQAGALTIRAAVGQGTDVTIRLPIAPAAAGVPDGVP